MIFKGNLSFHLFIGVHIRKHQAEEINTHCKNEAVTFSKI